MITCDTSVLVAAFARWHEAHHRAVAALARVDALIEHVALETFSVLTRLPSPRRVAPDLVATFVSHHFPHDVARLPAPSSVTVIEAAREGGVAGGAVYDLAIGLAAVQGGATLLSFDQRAVRTYDAAAVRYELLRTA